MKFTSGIKTNHHIAANGPSYDSYHPVWPQLAAKQWLHAYTEDPLAMDGVLTPDCVQHVRFSDSCSWVAPVLSQLITLYPNSSVVILFTFLSNSQTTCGSPRRHRACIPSSNRPRSFENQSRAIR